MDKLNEIKRTMDLLMDGGVTELRILNTPNGTVSGNFSNSEEAAKAAKAANGKHNVFMTYNPIDPKLLARANNKLIKYAKQTTSDSEIPRSRHFLIDLDPKRPAGISATDEEKQIAKKKLEDIVRFLSELGIVPYITADSGNGYHIILKTDMKNSAENVKLLEMSLKTLDYLFSDERVEVDRTTYNLSRIGKVYGTLACKGDNTEERPHRYSKIIHINDEAKVTPKYVLQTLVSHYPKIEQPKKSQSSKSKHKNDFDLEVWLKDHKINWVDKRDFHGKGFKYILEKCPFNEAHTDKSACVIDFHEGGIAAICQHNSCKGNNWSTLRKKYDPNWKSKSESVDDESKSVSQIIVDKILESSELYRDSGSEAYARVDLGTHYETLKISSHKFKLLLMKSYYDETGRPPNMDALNQAILMLTSKAIFDGMLAEFGRRVMKVDDRYYYDLVDPLWRVVEIGVEGCCIVEKPPVGLIRSNNMKQQVEPDLSSSPESLAYLLKHVFRFKSEDDLLLFAVYLVAALICDIPHPILVMHGEKGASKSTSQRMLRNTIDPAVQDLLSLPTGITELAIVLQNNYMPCFDNLDIISTEKSDMLCTAATGGGFSKRKLYSDDDETIIQFKRTVTLNGINVVANRSDLLDRSVLIELERIPKHERKTEKDVWETFNLVKPAILGSAMNTLSKAMSLYDSVQLDQLGRMADFTIWGYAVAEAMGMSGDDFLKAYLCNQDKANEEALSANPVASSVMHLMVKCPTWVGSVQTLLSELIGIATINNINMKVKAWPGAPHVLTMRLNEVKSNLEEVGITFAIRHAGKYKEITLERTADFNIVEASEVEGWSVEENIA